MGMDYPGLGIPQQLINLRQAVVDSLEIKNGFPKKMSELCTFMKEQYLERRREEKVFRQDEKRSGKYKFEIMPYEMNGNLSNCDVLL
jgi:hypothetical protein